MREQFNLKTQTTSMTDGAHSQFCNRLLGVIIIIQRYLGCLLCFYMAMLFLDIPQLSRVPRSHISTHPSSASFLKNNLKSCSFHHLCTSISSCIIKYSCLNYKVHRHNYQQENVKHLTTSSASVSTQLMRTATASHQPKCSLSCRSSSDVQTYLSYIPATDFSCSNDHNLHCLPYLSCTRRAVSSSLFIWALRKAGIQNQHPYPHRTVFGHVHKRSHLKDENGPHLPTSAQNQLIEPVTTG